MSVTISMVLLGALLVYGGFTNRSVWALARGDSTVAKPPEQAASAATGNIQGPARG